MKIKRSRAGKWYRQHIDELYEEVAKNEKPVRALL